eukprot:7991_1
MIKIIRMRGTNWHSDEYEIRTCELNSPQHLTDDPYVQAPLRDVLLTHPHYLSPQLLGIESINTCDIDVPIDIIDLQIQSPINKLIRAAADGGANIDAISGVESYKWKPHIKSERRAFRVRTGSGFVWCKDYLPLIVNNRGKKKKIKMYVIWDLPYDYLVGRGTQRDLGWELVQTGCSTY